MRVSISIYTAVIYYLFIQLSLFHTPSTATASTLTLDPDWMRDMQDRIYNYSLLDITLPGTHDSGAYVLEPIIGPGESFFLDAVIEIAAKLHMDVYELIASWAQAQNYSVYDQLMGGIRYIDVRACLYKGEWLTQHFLIGTPTQVILNDIRDFVGNHTGEVVVVQIGDLDGANDTQQLQLVRMILDTLGPYLLPVTARGLDIPIGELVELNSRVVVIYPNSTAAIDNFFLWNDIDWLEGSYADQDSLVDMLQWNTGLVNSLGGHGRLSQVSWTLTPQTKDVEDTIFNAHHEPRTLEELALVADAALSGFATTYAPTFKLGNLLLVDWFQDTSVVTIAKTANKRMCNDDSRYIAANLKGDYCRAWARDGLCDSETGKPSRTWMAEHCPLSCGSVNL